MPSEFGVRTGAVTLAVTAPALLTPDALDRIASAAGPLLPGGWTPLPAPPADPDARVLVRVSTGIPRVERAPDGTIQLTLRAPDIVGDSLAYLTYTVAEAARQHAGIATAHAAAATAPSGETVLLLGDKGAGKTTTLFALAGRGWQPVGDDLILLATNDSGELWVPAAKRVTAVRTPRPGMHGYESKSVVDIGSALVLPPRPVALVARLSVHPGAAALLRTGSPLRAVERLRLAENLARYITGTVTPLALTPEVCAPVYPFDTAAAVATRAALITAIEHTGLRYLQAPSPDHAADLLQELITS
jgi:hypothetical protein